MAESQLLRPDVGAPSRGAGVALQVPIIIGIGHERPMPIVRLGEVVAADCVTISFTFDHRYADGIHGAQMIRLFRKVFLAPDRYPEVFSPATAPAPEANEPDGPAAAQVR